MKFKAIGACCVWAILAVIMIGCGQRVNVETPQISINLHTSTITQDRYTKTATPVIANTATSTYTRSPTRTPRPTRTIFQTPTIPMATIAVVMTARPHLPICYPGVFWDLSPDGQWITDLCEREEHDGPNYLKALNIVDGREWRVDFDTEKYGSDGSLAPQYWTPDGKYTYIAVYQGGDGELLIYYNGSALLRLNLINGETVEILPLSFYSFSFSPNGKLAYISRPWNSPQKLDILDLNSWTGRRITLGEYCGVGQFLWALTEDQVVFQTATCKNEFYDIVSYSLVLLNLKDGSQKQLLVSSDELPKPLEWKDEYPVYIKRDYYNSGGDECWELIIETGELMPITCP